MSNLFSDLNWRGLVHQTTDEKNFGSWLNEEKRTLYIGFDPTADSLHVGSLLQLMMLRRYQQAGHRPIALVGGATGMIGDPSGKSQERNLLSEEALQHNVESLKVQMARFLDFESGDNSAILVNNYDWMGGLSYLHFLRDVGKHFPVNVMMAKESVKNRLGREDGGLSYTEFSYMLLQAYDFVHLQKEYDCQLQCGGSDQWGNITAGIDLGRRMGGGQLYGMTCPLLTNSEGAKMGKTEQGTVWLDRTKTSPYAFYQYWINVADVDVGRCLRFLTELNQEEIVALDASRENEPYRRESQKRLAQEMTELVHGKDGLSGALRATEVFFGAEINDLSEEELREIFAEVPSQELSKEELSGEGLELTMAMVEAGLAKSKGEARRIISQGGAYVNNRRVAEQEARVTGDHLIAGGTVILRSGKKKYGLLRFV
ncbi:MAG: tyrosine--tRNA ligase [Pirellulaceae bacterium]|nr:tyrosine--tRNA ligase [Pirellulaceae bacterium]